MSVLPPDILLEIFDLFDQDQCRPRLMNAWYENTEANTPLLPLLGVCKLWYRLCQPILYRRLRFQVTLDYGDFVYWETYTFSRHVGDEAKHDQRCKKLIRTLLQNRSCLFHLQEFHVVFPPITQEDECNHFFQQTVIRDLEQVLSLIPRTIESIRIEGVYHTESANAIATQIKRLQPRQLTLGCQWGDFLFLDLLQATAFDNLRRLVIREWSADKFDQRGFKNFGIGTAGRKLQSITFENCFVDLPSQSIRYLFSLPAALKRVVFATSHSYISWCNSNIGYGQVQTLLLQQAESLESLTHLDAHSNLDILQIIPNCNRLPHLRFLTIDWRHLSLSTAATIDNEIRDTNLQKLTVLDPGEKYPTLVVGPEFEKWLRDLVNHRLESRLKAHSYAICIALSEEFLEFTTNPWCNQESWGDTSYRGGPDPTWPWHSALMLRPILTEVDIELTWNPRWPLLSFEEWNLLLLRRSGRGGWPEAVDEYEQDQLLTIFDDTSEPESVISDGLNRCEFDNHWANMWDHETYKKSTRSPSGSESSDDELIG